MRADKNGHRNVLSFTCLHVVIGRKSVGMVIGVEENTQYKNE